MSQSKTEDAWIGTLTIDRTRGERSCVRVADDVRFLAMVGNLVGQTVRLHRLVSRDRERLLESQQRFEKAIEQAVPARVPELGGILGESRSIRVVMEKVRIVARSHTTVLLRGESGTGKELFARAVHDMSSASRQGVRQCQLRGPARVGSRV